MNRIIIVCNDIYRIVHSMLNWKPVRFGSARTGRVLQTQCQWPALGRNLHNFIWIVALINCPRFLFPLSPILSFCSFILSLAYCYDIQNIRFISLCACVPPSTPTLSPSLPPPVPMLSPAFDFSLIKLSASGYGFLSHYGSVLPPFFSTFFLSFFLVLLPLPLCGLAHTALPLSTLPWQKGSIFVSFGEHFYLLLRLCHGIDNRRSELKPHVLSRLHSREFPIVIVTNLVSLVERNWVKTFCQVEDYAD